MIFGQNPWTNPFKKCPFLTLFKTSIFSLKIVISFINIEKRSFLTKFQWKTAIIEILIFGQNPWANPFKKYPLFGSCWNFNYLVLKWLFSIQNIQKWFFSDIIAVKNSDKKKFDFWRKRHGLTPIKNLFFLPFLKHQDFQLKIVLFFPQYQKRCFLIEFLWKKQIRKGSILDQIHGLTPLKNVSFWVLVKTSIS